MKKTIFTISLALAVTFLLTATVQSQPGRGGYGYGRGRSYGRQSQLTGRSIEAKEAEAIPLEHGQEFFPGCGN